MVVSDWLYQESKVYYSTHFPEFGVTYVCVFEYCGNDSYAKTR